MVIQQTDGAIDEPNIRLMGMLITVSLGIFAILFLYVLYNMTVTIAGTTAAILLFIAFTFFVILLKIFKLFNHFIATTTAAASNADLSRVESIQTISGAAGDAANSAANGERRFSLPPSYDEAIKNNNLLTRSVSHHVLPPSTDAEMENSDDAALTKSLSMPSVPMFESSSSTSTATPCISISTITVTSEIVQPP